MSVSILGHIPRDAIWVKSMVGEERRMPRSHRHLGPAPTTVGAADEVAEPLELLRRLDELIVEVRRDGAARSAGWRRLSSDRDYRFCAQNLASYLAVRKHDLRPLQRSLTRLGLSSLGRMEGHVLPALEATRASLAAVVGEPAHARPESDAFFAGERCLARRRAALFGELQEERRGALMITCPREAAESADFMVSLAERRVEAVRINCAHDSPRIWRRMIGNLRAAEAQTGHRMGVFMDLAGPKIRTGAKSKGMGRLAPEDRFWLVRQGGRDFDFPDRGYFRVECELGEVIAASEPGDHVYYDDGKLMAVVEEATTDALLLKVERTAGEGVRIKPEKGLNFPDADLSVSALTEDDRKNLRFVAAHADAVEFSFVQTVEDVVAIQSALADLRDDWQALGLVLKIETLRAVDNLPDLIVQAASQQPTAVMIARGDLAVELGFARMAEMQEEILWLAEAAHVPVIWATQVLEALIKKGRPSRGEMTDAAMAARAECIMLNKGPFVLDAIDTLDTLTPRMGEHQRKKTAQLRALERW